MKSKKCRGCKTMIGTNTERMYNHLGTFCDYRCLDTYQLTLSQ